MLAVPCKTAHAFLARVGAEVDLPIVHMIEETATRIHLLRPTIQRVGLLSATGTQKAGLYQAWLDKKGIQVLSPSAHSQANLVMASIRAIKGEGRTAPRPSAGWLLLPESLSRLGRRRLLAAALRSRGSFSG